jgi:hypothetical protein
VDSAIKLEMMRGLGRKQTCRSLDGARGLSLKRPVNGRSDASGTLDSCDTADEIGLELSDRVSRGASWSITYPAAFNPQSSIVNVQYETTTRRLPELSAR